MYCVTISLILSQMLIQRLLKFLLATLVLFPLNSKASHVPGGNITYENIGPNTFVITLTLFEDCGTAFTSNLPETIDITNNCGLSFSSTISLPNIIFQQEVSQLCSASLPASECNGGSLPGVYMHVWQDTITLPGPCDSWIFSYSSCCRNSSNNLNGTSSDYYWESVLNSNTAPSNTSPQITSQPIPYYCVNQPVVYNFGVYEPDGDSLVYSLINALTGSGTSAPYQAGYTGTSPINGINIDPSTGEITFTPNMVGNFVVAVLIEEFDTNGNLVGSIIQDFQFEIVNVAGCGNNNPVPPAGGLSNFNSTAVLSGPYSIQACEGDNICFDIVFTDAVSANGTIDSIYINSNIAQLFPGGTITQNTYFSPASATVCFDVLPGSNPFSTISFDVNDNACPIVGISSAAVGVTVISSTYAGQDVTMCQGVGTQLVSTGGSNFNWAVISGDPINIGSNFSCNNCPNPIANPAFTTVYEVTSNLSGGCTNTDTVEVTVVPDFTYYSVQSSTGTCLNSNVQFNTTPNPSGAYTYQWTPSSNLNSATIPNPIFNSGVPGVYDLELTITSSLGCVKVDTLSVDVIAAYSPNITLSASDTNILCGDSVFFDIDLGGGIPAVSGPSNLTSFAGPFTQNTLNNNGCTSSNTATAFPAVFGNWYKNAKHQFLYTAAELQASGFIGGIITEIAWETNAQNTATSTFNGYTIKMGFTTNNSLTTWATGLTTVFSPQNINVVLGWNVFQLTTAYEWDGISNLIIEVCYDNLSSNYTRNWSTPYCQTPFNSVLYYRSDLTPACPYTGLPTTSNERPVTRFNTCPAVPDPNNYTYQWFPNTFLSSNTAQNPYALPMVTTNYSAVVTDISGGCSDSTTLMINVLCDTCDAPIPTFTNVTCYGGNDGSITGVPGGSDGPPWILQLVDPSTGSLYAVDSNVTTSFFFDSLSAGTYSVRSIDTTGCYADTLITIPPGVSMVLTTTSDTIICLGGSATIGANVSGGNAPYTLNWEDYDTLVPGLNIAGLSGNGPHVVSPQFTQFYTLTATDSSGCTSQSSSIMVALNPPILTTICPEDTVCPYDDVNLFVSAAGGMGAPYTYSWVDENGFSAGMFDSISTIPTATSTWYYVTVEDNCETPPVTDSVRVLWYPLPDVDLSVVGNTGCYPITVEFTNTTSPSLVQDCFWDFGNGDTSVVCGTVQNTFYNPGFYDVQLTVTSPQGCVNDSVFDDLVEVYDYPQAAFSSYPNPVQILTPTVQFTDSSSNDVVSFSWSFMDSVNNIVASSNDENPNYTFPDDFVQNYKVELVVTNQNGCTDTAYGLQVINGFYAIYLPNTFTPNGDNKNDIFKVEGENIGMLNFSFEVYNRWGELIFFTDNPYEGWDGKDKSKSDYVQNGVYLWKVKARDKVSGKVSDYNGYVLKAN